MHTSHEEEHDKHGMHCVYACVYTDADIFVVCMQSQCVIVEKRKCVFVFIHLFGSLHGITGGVSDLWRRLSVDLIIELEQTREMSQSISQRVKLWAEHPKKASTLSST